MREWDICEKHLDEYAGKCDNPDHNIIKVREVSKGSEHPQEWTPEKLKRFLRKGQELLLLSGEPQWDLLFKLVSDAHNAALAAEREKTRILGNMTDGFRQQLLAAQAAIKKVLNRKIYVVADIIADLESVDLSALERHDDEVRKPLVDAIDMAIKELRHANSNAGTRAEVADELEKVKRYGLD